MEKFFEKFDKSKSLVWNGNEIVFEGAENVGVAGIAQNMPDEFAIEIVKRWNAQKSNKVVKPSTSTDKPSTKLLGKIEALANRTWSNMSVVSASEIRTEIIDCVAQLRTFL